MNLQRHVTTRLQESAKFRVPFPFFFAQNVFPDDFYDELMGILANKTDFHAEKFANREFADEIGIPALDFMKTPGFFNDMLKLFGPEAMTKFGGVKHNFSIDARLIRDSRNYKIGPHTDIANKVLSLLFYLPATDEYRDFGTSIFVPDDPTFRCKGGPHHPFGFFHEVFRAPFLPNTCFGFWKTDNSFHGVNPIPVQFRRDVLLFNIYVETAKGK